MGLNGTLALAGRALEVFSTGIEVAGQNVSNASTPGYIREELILESADSFKQGQLVKGTGVVAVGVKQQIDLFLEVRLHDANTNAAEANATDTIYKQLEAEVRELGEGDLSTSLNKFLASLNDVASEPESTAIRDLAVAAGELLASDIVSLRSRVDELRTQQSVKIDSLVEEANQLVRKIVDLNPRIAKLESAGLLQSDAGALRSQRYEALNRLSEIVPIEFREAKDGTIDVISGSDWLILGNEFQQLETTISSDRGVVVQSVQLSVTKSDVTRNGGELAGIVAGRDDVLGGFVDDLDLYAKALIRDVNELHASGQGLNGFETLTAVTAVTSTTADLDDATAGLPFTPTHGSFQVVVTNKGTGQGTTVDIAVDLDGVGTDDGLDDIQTKLNAVGNLTASITTDGRLQLTAASGYEFSFAEDTSGLLAALGVNTFFTGTGSGNIGVNAVVANDSRNLAVALGGGPADGSNAVRIADFHTQARDHLNGSSLDDFYRNTVTKIAQESAGQEAVAAGLDTFRDSLFAQRTQFSGVSLDEEAIKILEFQRSFQAAARLISTVDELFGVLLSI